MSSADANHISSTLSSLSLDTRSSKQPVKPRPKKDRVLDSWEDEDVSTDTETEAEAEADPEADKTSRPAPAEDDPRGTSAPPPTPVTPSHGQGSFSSAAPSAAYHLTGFSGPPAARPEKTDAVARRLIAGALGVRAPKLTEEQKAYDKAVREKERRRKEEEKAAERRKEEEAARAKAAMWDS